MYTDDRPMISVVLGSTDDMSSTSAPNGDVSRMICDTEFDECCLNDMVREGVALFCESGTGPLFDVPKRNCGLNVNTSSLPAGVEDPSNEPDDINGAIRFPVVESVFDEFTSGPPWTDEYRSSTGTLCLLLFTIPETVLSSYLYSDVEKTATHTACASQYMKSSLLWAYTMYACE